MLRQHGRILAIVDCAAAARFARKSIAIVASFACEEICDLRRLNDSGPAAALLLHDEREEAVEVFRDGESIFSADLCEWVWLVHEERACDFASVWSVTKSERKQAAQTL